MAFYFLQTGGGTFPQCYTLDPLLPVFKSFEIFTYLCGFCVIKCFWWALKTSLHGRFFQASPTLVMSAWPWLKRPRILDVFINEAPTGFLENIKKL